MSEELLIRNIVDTLDPGAHSCTYETLSIVYIMTVPISKYILTSSLVSHVEHHFSSGFCLSDPLINEWQNVSRRGMGRWEIKLCPEVLSKTVVKGYF